MLPQLDIIVYPDDWAQIDAMRLPRRTTLAQLPPEEEIDRNLDQVVTFDFRELTFRTSSIICSETRRLTYP